MVFAMGVGVVGATVLAMATPAAAVFSPATGVKVGVDPSSIAVADFNGDGKLDLAVANAGSGTVSLVLNDGFGLWRLGPDDVRVPDPKLREVWGRDRPREWWDRPIPRAVVAADFNGDGKADFAITNEAWNTVSVRLGNGDGSFTAAPDVGVGQLPVSAVVTDFNADGKPDLAVANSSSNNVSVRLGDGAGNFTAAPDVGVRRYPSSVALGDFNGDAKPDLAIANYGGERRPGDGLDGEGSIISVRLGDGAGGFTAAPDAYASPPVFRWQSRAASVTVGDFNGDAKADLAVVDAGRGAVAVSWGDGGGNFAKPIDVWRSGENGSTGEWGRDDPSFLTVADFEGDGASDLAVVNTGSDSVSVPVGHRNSLVDGGCLQDCMNPDVPVRNSPRAVAAADFNGDGKPDLVTANNDSDTLGTLSVHFSGYDGGQLLFHAATGQRAGVGTGSVATADFNGDGRLDLVASNTFSNSVSLLLGDGIGFWRRGTHDISVPDPWGPSAVVTADFNGDGNADFATTPSAGDTLSVFLGNGAASFTSAPAVSLGQGPSHAAVGDFNGDGKPDLAVTHYFANTVSIRLGDGAGNFTAAPDVAVGGGPRSVAVGDFNGDGKADLAAANKSGGASGGGFVSVRLGDGTGRFTAAPDVEVSRPVLRPLSEAAAVAVGDFNGDAKADLAVADDGNNAVVVLLGDGAGNFTLRTDTGMQDMYGRQGPSFVAVGDFNRDGASDLAVVNSLESSVSVPLGWGDGMFRVCDRSLPYGCVPPSQVPDVRVGRNPRAVAVGDFNGDGKPDLATANNESNTLGTVSVHLNGLPDQTVPDTTITATPPNPSNSTSATFSFTGTDPGGGVVRFDCRLDDAEYFTACTSPMTYSGLAPGSHTVQVRAIDAVGNSDPSPATYTWTISAPTDTTSTTVAPTTTTSTTSTTVAPTTTTSTTSTTVAPTTTTSTSTTVAPTTTTSTTSTTVAAPAAPAVTVTQAPGQADPTSSAPVNFTAVFSAPVSGFTNADVTVTGTAPGPKSVVVTGSGTTYNLAVSGMTPGVTMTGGGTVAVSIPANVVDGGNQASTSTDDTVTFSVATRPALVRASTGRLLRNETTSGQADAGDFSYGGKPLTPLFGDWDGNGTKTPGTFEAGVFKLRNANSAGAADITFPFGDPRGFPVAGDFNGDRIDDVAVYRNGLWQVRYSTGEVPPTFTFGSGSWPATVPVVGDWDGDGVDGVGVFVAGTWTLRSRASADGVDSTVTFGPGTSPYPVVGDWNGDGIDTVGVKAGTGTTWRLSNSSGPAPPVEITFDFGQPNTDLPMAWR